LALKIIDECIACDACVESCPTDAITPDDPIYIIDADICCECYGYKDEHSCVAVCPVDAIVIDESITESEQTLQEKYKKSVK
jgi:ferredoxin